MAYVGEREFRAYHAAWWQSIWGPILAPAALVLGTSIWWGPLMARLETPSGALDLTRYRLMFTSHWIRVAIVSAYGILVLWMLAESAWGR